MRRRKADSFEYCKGRKKADYRYSRHEAEQAKFRLETVIENCSAEINEIVVIHGCNHGQALKNMVREELKSPGIKQISASLLNDGQTVITLRRKK